MHGARLGLILAGGRGRRLGGTDKALLSLGGCSLLDHVAARLGPQCDAGLVLSANGDAGRFAALGIPVIPDGSEGFAGPLAGILAGLDWAAAQRPDVAAIASAPVDAPFLPPDLVVRLGAAREAAGLGFAAARSGGRDHVAHALWPVEARSTLRDALAAGEHRVGAWLLAQGCALAEWPAGPFDPFLNINTAEDLGAAERLLARLRHDLDLTGLKCPLPALKTAKALRALTRGDILSVTCTDPMAAIDIPNLVRETGDRLLGRNTDAGGTLSFLIIRA